MAEQTRLMDIYKHLKDAGVEVYFPSQKKGECKAPYVVVKDSGTAQYQTFSSDATTYEILCYVPVDRYSTLQVFAAQIKELMRGLWPMIVPIRYETPPFYDDTVNAHMTSIQYRNIKYSPIGGI